MRVSLAAIALPAMILILLGGRVQAFESDSLFIDPGPGHPCTFCESVDEATPETILAFSDNIGAGRMSHIIGPNGMPLAVPLHAIYTIALDEGDPNGGLVTSDIFTYTYNTATGAETLIFTSDPVDPLPNPPHIDQIIPEQGDAEFPQDANGFFHITDLVYPGVINQPHVVEIASEIADGAPEPATWAMLMLGFAGIGMLHARTRRRSAIA